MSEPATETTAVVEGLNPNVEFLALQLKDLLSAGAEITSDAVQELLMQVHYYGVALTVLGTIKIVLSIGIFGFLMRVLKKRIEDASKLEKPKPRYGYDNTIDDSDLIDLFNIVLSIVAIIAGAFIMMGGFDNLHDGILAMTAPMIYMIELLNGM